jgi:hypothetical protein
MKQLGRKITVSKELKALKEEHKRVKVNSLARRDNDRAIQLLQQRIKDEKYRHEYLRSKI